MANSVPQDQSDDGEEVNKARTKVDMLLLECESNVCLAKRLVEGFAQSSRGDEQNDCNQRAVVSEADDEGEHKHEDDDQNELTNQEKLQLAMWRHGSNENKMSHRANYEWLS